MSGDITHAQEAKFYPACPGRILARETYSIHLATALGSHAVGHERNPGTREETAASTRCGLGQVVTGEWQTERADLRDCVLLSLQPLAPFHFCTQCPLGQPIISLVATMKPPPLHRLSCRPNSTHK